ncbi:MAG: hypothetical protein KAI24_14015 [Planctomycetes bacterium]|nr:hypothetical protein [Planctomycetota bacterium]
MTLNDLYLLSQILAVALVAPTLVYLALQVRQNTAMLRATARYQFVEATGQMNALLAGDPAVASIFRRGCADIATLSDDERMQFTVFLGHCLQIYSTMYELHTERLLPGSQWHNVRKDLLSALSAPGGAAVWESFGRHGLDPEFVRFVDALLQGGEGSYDMTRF